MLFSTDLRLTCAPTTGRRVCFHKKKVDAHATAYQLSQHTSAVTVGCPSNGCRASSISALHATAAQTSASGTACSLLSRPAMLQSTGLTAPPYSHRWPSHPSTHPHMLLFSGDSRRTSKPSYSSAWETTAEYSLASCRSLPRPRRRPPPWCSRRDLVNMVNERHPSEVDCTWRG